MPDGRLLYHPYPVQLPPEEQPDPDFFGEGFWEREQVLDYMRRHSLSKSVSSSDDLGASGLSTVHTRRPFVGELKTFTSPEDPETTFYIKRCGVRENITRRNLSATVRYVTEEGSDRSVMERDYPAGTLELETIALALSDWNIHDEQKNKVPITTETIQSWLSPTEYNFVLRKVFEVNPMWAGGGEEETKND